jgi:hypothetical protein
MKKLHVISVIFFSVLLQAAFATHAYAFDISGMFYNILYALLALICITILTVLTLMYLYNVSRKKNEKKEGVIINFDFYLDLFERTENFSGAAYLIGMALPALSVVEGMLSRQGIFFISSISTILIIFMPVIFVLSLFSLKALNGIIEFKDADLAERGKNILMMIIENSIAENIALMIIYLMSLWIAGIMAFVLILVYL